MENDKGQFTNGINVKWYFHSFGEWLSQPKTFCMLRRLFLKILAQLIKTCCKNVFEIFYCSFSTQSIDLKVRFFIWIKLRFEDEEFFIPKPRNTSNLKFQHILYLISRCAPPLQLFDNCLKMADLQNLFPQSPFWVHSTMSKIQE